MANIPEKSFFHSIPGKVIAAFLLGAIAVALSWAVMQLGFKEMLSTVNRISEPNEKLRLVNNLFYNITQLEQLQRAQALRNAGTANQNFQGNSKHLIQTIDSLRQLSLHNPLQVKRLDSMVSILQIRDKLFSNYYSLRADLVKNEALSRRINYLSKIISDSKPKVDSSVITTQKTITTTTIMPSELDPDTTVQKPKKSFFSRLFGNSREDEITDLPPMQYVEEALSVQVDTLAIARQDSSIFKVEKVLRRIERDYHQRNAMLLSRELELINTVNHLHRQLLDIIHAIDAEEVALVKSNSRAATEVVNASISRINSIMVAFFFGAALLIFLILIDISRSNKYRKQLVAAKEEAEHLGQVKQRFLANMSHEIRTPLQAIIGFAEQVREQPVPNRASLEAIYRSAGHLLQIVNEVLDYSRIESGKFTFEKQPFNMLELVEEVAETMRLPASQKNLKFNLHTAFDNSLLYAGDPFRLRQILFNLLGNAVKFTTEGEITLSVQANPATGAETMFTFSVRDTGCGIPASETDRVFEVFEQASAVHARTHGGTGLGLSIVKKLAEGQHGTVSVESTPGAGSCFTVTIPYEKAEALPAATPAAACVPANFSGSVLVVDDDAFILEVCKTIFEKHGIRHVCTSAAVDVLEQTHPTDLQLVLLDIRMPEISGPELCLLLRKRLPEHVKIAALTAQALPEEREKIVRQGFDALLMKPFREQELLALLHQFSAPEKIQPSVISPEPDLTQLRKMTFGDEAQLQRILLQFLEDTRFDLEALQLGVEENSAAHVREVVHRLAGRTGQLGATQLAARLREAETALHRQQPLHTVQAELEALQEALCQLQDKITERLALAAEEA